MSGEGEADLDGSWIASANVRLRDSTGGQVAGATVTVQWSGAFSGSASDVTNSGGVAHFSTPVVGPNVTITVINVTHPELTYDPALNNVTSITILEPTI